MFHINPESGVSGPCRAEQGNCPFGGAEEHFATKEQAEAHFERSMQAQVLVAHQKEPVPPTRAADELRRAVTLSATPEEGQARWLQEAAQRASTEEGAAEYAALLSEQTPGTPAHALYSHILAEGNKLRVQAMGLEEMMEILNQPRSATPAARQSAELVPTLPRAKRPEGLVDWSTFGERVSVGTGSATDMVRYEEALEKTRSLGLEASASDLHAALPAMSAYSDMWVQSPPRANYNGEYLIPWSEWSPMSRSTREYSRELARELMSHPNADLYVFERVAEVHDDTLAATHPNAPLKFKEDLIAQRRSKLDPAILPTMREEQLNSNRIALYLAAYDPDTEHRANAFNQVTVMGMETLTKGDRAWMAANLDKFPTSEVTQRTLVSSLRAWAIGHADSAEREKLLSLLPEEKAATPERRGFFRR